MLATPSHGLSQTGYNYMNQWYHFDQNYIKLMANQDGIYRLDLAQLQASGVSTAGLNPQNIQVFYRGEEIPVYVESNGGSFAYLEFVGKKNDGQLDRTMYRNPYPPYNYDPEQHLQIYSSFFTDTSAYFVTWDDVGTRFLQGIYPQQFQGKTPEPYFRYRSLRVFETRHFFGGGSSTNAYHRLNPDYITGEGLTDRRVKPGEDLSYLMPTPGYANTGQPSKIAAATVQANTAPQHIVQILVALQDAYRDTSSGINSRIHSFDRAYQVNATTPITFRALGPTVNDREDIYHPAWAFIEYDRTFDLMGAGQTIMRHFQETDTTYLRFYNADVSQDAWIIDSASNLRIRGMVSGDTLHFLVPGHPGERTLYVSTDNGLIRPGLDPTPSLSNLSNVNGGAEFVILTHRKFANSARRYAAYRDTCSVNQLSSKVVYVDEIYDEFGYGSRTSLAIKNFCKYALDNWTVRPKFFMIWGKGREAPKIDDLNNFIPSWGSPANDYEFVSNFDRDTINLVPEVPIGRVSFFTDQEAQVYLDKVRFYEFQPYDSWMKDALFLGGGKTYVEQVDIKESLTELYLPRVEDAPLYGKGYYFQTFNNGTLTNSELSSEKHINNGVGIIHFFGHSSTNIFDVDILEPNLYTNYGKIPFMLAFGCYGGAYTDREQTFGERFLLEKDRGSIGYVANTTAGFLRYLKDYGKAFYTSLLNQHYGEPIGTVLQTTIYEFGGHDPTNIYVANHAKQVNLQGDPSIVLKVPDRADLSILEEDVYFTPEDVSAQDNSFQLNMLVHNYGRIFEDSFRIHVSHRLPGGQVVDYEDIISGPIPRVDTIVMQIENTVGSAIAGLNTFSIQLDVLDSIYEYREDNNALNLDVLIQGNIPAVLFPYEFAVVPDPNVVLEASQWVIQGGKGVRYTFEIDTVPEFNSPRLLNSGPVEGRSALGKWEVPFQLVPGEVYFWRVRLSDTYPMQWNTSSFKYVPGKTGWSQSHYAQFMKDEFDQIELNEVEREWKFSRFAQQLHAFVNSVEPISGRADYFLSGYGSNGEARPGILYTAIDQYTLIPHIQNTQYGDWAFLASPTPQDPTNNSIYMLPVEIAATKPGDYFLIVTSDNPFMGLWKPEWFQAMEMIGVDVNDVIGQQNGQHLIVLGRKGAPVGTAHVITEPNLPLGTGQDPRLDLLVDLLGTYSSASVRTQKIGPAKAWSDYQFGWDPLEPFEQESLPTHVRGIRTDESENPLLADLTEGLHSLSAVNADSFPYLKLEGNPRDELRYSAPQLDNWEIYYVPGPDVAVDPDVLWQIPDTIEEGQIVEIGLGARNVSDFAMDSLLVRFEVQLEDRSRILLGEQRYAAIPAGDSLSLNFQFTTAARGLTEGLATMFITLNPDQDQVEQYVFNNLFSDQMFIKTDHIGPILDVTIDGKRLMDGDIVQPEPEIVIMINDENEFLPVSISDSTYRIRFGLDRSPNLNQQILIDGNPRMEYIPASLPENKARLVFRPERLGDGEYTLSVQGYDFKGNRASDEEYIIHFNVENRKSISEVLPYPNPFSSSTRFVYTLTGDEKPYVFEIHIYTVTGRLVKVIDLLAEGEVFFGYNITEYTWDGTDEFGDQLANGVYLYKTVTKFEDRFGVEQRDEGIGEYFDNGFGKMYIMR